MSIKVMTWVFDNSAATGSDRLVLLALADHADDETWSCYPGIARLARKARISESTVHRCLRSLEHEGYVAVVRQGGPAYRGDRKPNLYTIHRDGVSDWHPVEQNTTDGVSDWHPVASTGCHISANGVSTVTPKPSLEPSLVIKSELSKTLSTGRAREVEHSFDWVREPPEEFDDSEPEPAQPVPTPAPKPEPEPEPWEDWDARMRAAEAERLRVARLALPPLTAKDADARNPVLVAWLERLPKSEQLQDRARLCFAEMCFVLDIREVDTAIAIAAEKSKPLPNYVLAIAKNRATSDEVGICDWEAERDKNRRRALATSQSSRSENSA